ncbi:MAG: hypothetical protein JW764_04330, partial [Chlorobiaceae bacterium]|nr:hypothetical protein [Chlorobiaceae bacterium]
MVVMWISCNITTGKRYWFVTNRSIRRENPGKTATHETAGKILILRLMGTSKNLLRVTIAALGGARNPHVLRVRSG